MFSLLLTPFLAFFVKMATLMTTLCASAAANLTATAVGLNVTLAGVHASIGSYLALFLLSPLSGTGALGVVLVCSLLIFVLTAILISNRIVSTCVRAIRAGVMALLRLIAKTLVRVVLRIPCQLVSCVLRKPLTFFRTWTTAFARSVYGIVIEWSGGRIMCFVKHHVLGAWKRMAHRVEWNYRLMKKQMSVYPWTQAVVDLVIGADRALDNKSGAIPMGALLIIRATDLSEAEWRQLRAAAAIVKRIAKKRTSNLKKKRLAEQPTPPPPVLDKDGKPVKPVKDAVSRALLVLHSMLESDYVNGVVDSGGSKKAPMLPRMFWEAVGEILVYIFAHDGILDRAHARVSNYMAPDEVGADVAGVGAREPAGDRFFTEEAADERRAARQAEWKAYRDNPAKPQEWEFIADRAAKAGTDAELLRAAKSDHSGTCCPYCKKSVYVNPKGMYYCQWCNLTNDPDAPLHCKYCGKMHPKRECPWRDHSLGAHVCPQCSKTIRVNPDGRYLCCCSDHAIDLRPGVSTGVCRQCSTPVERSLCSTKHRCGIEDCSHKKPCHMAIERCSCTVVKKPLLDGEKPLPGFGALPICGDCGARVCRATCSRSQRCALNGCTCKKPCRNVTESCACGARVVGTMRITDFPEISFTDAIEIGLGDPRVGRAPPNTPDRDSVEPRVIEDLANEAAAILSDATPINVDHSSILGVTSDSPEERIVELMMYCVSSLTDLELEVFIHTLSDFWKEYRPEPVLGLVNHASGVLDGRRNHSNLVRPTSFRRAHSRRPTGISKKDQKLQQQREFMDRVDELQDGVRYPNGPNYDEQEEEYEVLRKGRGSKPKMTKAERTHRGNRNHAILTSKPEVGGTAQIHPLFSKNCYVDVQVREENEPLVIARGCVASFPVNGEEIRACVVNAHFFKNGRIGEGRTLENVYYFLTRGQKWTNFSLSNTNAVLLQCKCDSCGSTGRLADAALIFSTSLGNAALVSVAHYDPKKSLFCVWRSANGSQHVTESLPIHNQIPVVNSKKQCEFEIYTKLCTDINEGSSGTPVFQLENGSPKYVGLVLGIGSHEGEPWTRVLMVRGLNYVRPPPAIGLGGLLRQ